MRTTVAAFVLAVVAALPVAAAADILVTPYAGVNFGASTVDPRANVGASVAWLGSSGLGFEVDLGFIPDFFAPKDLDLDVLGKNNVTSLMGNVIFGRSSGRVQPYVSAGGGLLRSQVGSFGEFLDAVDTGFGVNAGVGVRLGAGRFGIRGDVRYFRTLTGVDEFVLEEVLGDFAFWRAAAGLSLRF